MALFFIWIPTTAKIEKTFGFVIQKIVVEGRGHTSRAALLNAMNIASGDGLFSFSIHEMSSKIKACPFVRNVVIQRHWPDRLTVYLVEKDPIAVFEKEGFFSVIDDEGKIIEGVDPMQYPHLLTISGEKSCQHILSLIHLLSQFQTDLPKVKKAVFLSTERWDLYFENGLKVKLPETDIQKALSQLIHWLPFFEKEKAECVDLRFSDAIILQPSYVKEEQEN